MGSVKDLKILEPAYENRQGLGQFHFSDRYSVFDWGEMPDQIKNKGRVLATMAAFNFEQLEQRGIKSHYIGLIIKGNVGNFQKLELRNNGSEAIEFSMAVRYDPIARMFESQDSKPRTEYDYSFFEMNRGKLNNFLVPLEIIFRNGLPKGSSVFKRLKEAANTKRMIKPILKELGLTEIPQEGDMLPKPVISYTTKLEPSDRSLTEHEAYRISGLIDEQFSKVNQIALQVNDYINERAEQTGLTPHWDGKIEMIYKKLIVADVVGTLDEDRFGDRISKEFLRQWYIDNQLEWRDAVEEVKVLGQGWQDKCPIKPMRLPKELSTLVSQMYMSAANKWIGKNIFPDVPELEKVMEDLKPFRD